MYVASGSAVRSKPGQVRSGLLTVVQHSSRRGGRGERRRRRGARVQRLPADGSAREQLVEGQRLSVELQLLLAQRGWQRGLCGFSGGQAEALAAVHLLVPVRSPQSDNKKYNILTSANL